jgi:hypothetical protein
MQKKVSSTHIMNRLDFGSPTREKLILCRLLKNKPKSLSNDEASMMMMRAEPIIELFIEI